MTIPLITTGIGLQFGFFMELTLIFPIFCDIRVHVEFLCTKVYKVELDALNEFQLVGRQVGLSHLVT